MNWLPAKSMVGRRCRSRFTPSRILIGAFTCLLMPDEILGERGDVAHLDSLAEAQRNPRRLRAGARIDDGLGRPRRDQAEPWVTVDLDWHDERRSARPHHLSDREQPTAHLERLPAAAAPSKLHDLRRPAVPNFGVAKERFELVTCRLDVAFVPEGPTSNSACFGPLDPFQELDGSVEVEPSESHSRGQKPDFRLLTGRPQGVFYRGIRIVEVTNSVALDAPVVPALGVRGPVRVRTDCRSAASGEERAGEDENEGTLGRGDHRVTPMTHTTQRPGALLQPGGYPIARARSRSRFVPPSVKIALRARRATLFTVDSHLTGPVVRDGRDRDVLTLPVLLLNRFFAPVTITNARRAFVLLYGGAARAVDDHGDAHDFEAWLGMPLRHEDDPLPVIGRSIRYRESCISCATIALPASSCASRVGT